MERLLTDRCRVKHRYIASHLYFIMLTVLEQTNPIQLFLLWSMKTRVLRYPHNFVEPYLPSFKIMAKNKSKSGRYYITYKKVK